jgi:hypothetical protein
MSDTNEGKKPQDPAGTTNQLARLLFATARTLYRVSLMGVPCQAFEEMKYKVNLPRAGDWALEVTHFSTRDTAGRGDMDMTRLGRIVRMTDEKSGRVVFLEGIDGTLHRWPNADFIRIFDNPFAEIGDEERLAWVAAAEKRHGLANTHGGAVIK